MVSSASLDTAELAYRHHCRMALPGDYLHVSPSLLRTFMMFHPSFSTAETTSTTPRQNIPSMLFSLHELPSDAVLRLFAGWKSRLWLFPLLILPPLLAGQALPSPNVSSTSAWLIIEAHTVLQRGRPIISGTAGLTHACHITSALDIRLLQLASSDGLIPMGRSSQ